MNGNAEEESKMLGKKKQLIEQTHKRQKNKDIHLGAWLTNERTTPYKTCAPILFQSLTFFLMYRFSACILFF